MSKYTNKLSNTTVLIIGGTSGLGFGLAEALLEQNIGHLYISSSRQPKLDATISRLRDAYPDSQATISGIACNLGDEANLEANVRRLFSNIDKKLDHVVFTAGDALATKPLGDVDMAFLKQAGMVRFFAPLLVAKEALAHMNPGAPSSITLTSGSIAEKPIPNWTVVGAYAAGLHGMVRGLALDAKPLRVNLIAPGAVATELWETSLGSQESAKALMESMKKTLATGEVGKVEDVVEAYLYVLKDRNVTGTIIRSDGGAFVM